MSGPSDRRFDLNLGEETATPSPDNIWRPSFISPTGPLTVGDSVMKNDMTAAVVARNLLTPKDNRLLSKRSDELAVKDSLALSVQCAGSVSNMAQRLFARTRQVESLAAEVMSLKQEIRGLKHENKQLHRLAHDYATNMKRKLDQMKESDGKVLLDHQRFVGLFQRHLLPSSSGAVPGNEASNDEPPMPPPSGVLSSTEAPDNHPPVLSLSGALPTAETSPKQPLLEKSKSLSGCETAEYQGAVAYGGSPPSLQAKRPEWMQDNTFLYSSDCKVVFMKVFPYLVNYNISKFEIHRSSTTSEIQLVNYNISKFEIPRSSITPEIQLVNYNISKFEIPRSSITPEIQIFETSQQLRNLQESDCHVWSFNTLISVAQTEMVPS
ncbi:hypothetical protein ACFX2H_036765 [Malus domestica]